MDTHYLFAYFMGNGEDGLHLAVSADGYGWRELAGGRSVLAPRVGAAPLMRDPFLRRGWDGKFHLLWTTAWEGREIGHASSDDLVTWSEQRALPVMAHEPTTRNCWAPEMAWDARRGRWVIFWASTIPGRFRDSDGSSESGYNHRMYATTTADFERFTATELFYDPGFSVIDATIVEQAGRYHLIVKDETLTPPKKHLRSAVAADVMGPWGPLSAPFTRDWVEGPAVMRVGDEWLLYFDAYRDGHYAALRSADLETWEEVTARVTFPPGIRHASVLAVPAEVVARLEERWG